MDLLFERLKTQRDEWPKILAIDIFPEKIRWQCWHIWKNEFTYDTYANECAKKIATILEQKIGVKNLNNSSPGFYGRHYLSELEHFFINGLEDASDQENIDYIFSALELMCMSLNKANIAKINKQLRCGGIGYIFIEKKLLPVQDCHLNSSCIIPAVTMLNTSEFCPAYNYVKAAYDDLSGTDSTSLESAVDNIQKAVETLLKIIFKKLEIDFVPRDTYMPLIQKAADNDLLIPCSQGKLNPLLPQLSSNLKRLGEMRNKSGGHGKINSRITAAMVRLAINHAMADMLYIIESYEVIKSRSKQSKKPDAGTHGLTVG